MKHIQQLLLLGILIVTLIYLSTYLERQMGITPATPTAGVTGKPTIQQAFEGECVPTFRDGGGPNYVSNAPFRERISPDEHNGEQLVVSGRVFEKDCMTPVANAVVDIWQANETGNYEDEWYRGRVRTDEGGNYTFETVIPKGYGGGTGYRPPHIHFKVFKDDKELVTSQMFLPMEQGNPGIDKAYIMEVDNEEMGGRKIYFGYHHIILP